MDKCLIFDRKKFLTLNILKLNISSFSFNKFRIKLLHSKHVKKVLAYESESPVKRH